MKILLVEDNMVDREVLKYLLESRLGQKVCFLEAHDLSSAMAHASQANLACIILDLKLPDSSGPESFLKLSSRRPEVPIVVMTNNQDRDLAIEMIHRGAADFVIKDFTNEEELFRRVIFAIEKHRRTIRLLPEDAEAVQRLDKARANLLEAKNPQEIAETTAVVADMSRRIYQEIQQINVSLAVNAAQQERLTEQVAEHDRELLRGYPSQPALKPIVSSLEERIEELESEMTAQKNEAKEQAKTAASNRVRVWVAIISLIGVLTTAAVTAYKYTKTPTYLDPKHQP